MTYAQGGGNGSEQICVTTFHERVPFRCPTPVQTCTKNNVHLLRLLPCYHEYGWKFIFHCEYEWIGWVVMYPCHIWFWFCGCFPKFLTHFFDKKCCATRLNLGVFHQKRRNSRKNILGNGRGVGQSDALIYYHPIDHSNDRYRERFFSSRNGIGQKISVERPKSTIFWPTKEQASAHGEHKNPTFFDFVVNISPPKVNNTGCCINHHSFCDDFCLQHPKRRRQTAILSILAFRSRVKAT